MRAGGAGEERESLPPSHLPRAPSAPRRHGELSLFHPSPPFRQPKELHPSAALPLDALLAFVYFDLNFCGYLHRRDLEKILLTLGLRLCKEQVSAGGSDPAPAQGFFFFLGPDLGALCCGGRRSAW